MANIKLRVIGGSVTHNGKDYRQGDALSIPEADAKRLIELGVCERAKTAKPVEDPPPEETPEENPEEGGQ
uniref:DUF7210 domain-containing protein n=1 Tax=Candidatus Kentrum sp. LFY TaxID=2126342 RepID=A0A450W6U8_9GAMM|nr:MAG: hypothetical protein BECKLFY1418C_GA0070996_100185 [Candidatus Kentron sp. LFY]